MMEKTNSYNLSVCLFCCLVSQHPRQLLGYIAAGPKTAYLTMLRPATHKTERGDHDFCLSRSHYTDTDPTIRERGATKYLLTKSRVKPTKQPLPYTPPPPPPPPKGEDLNLTDPRVCYVSPVSVFLFAPDVRKCQNEHSICVRGEF